MNAFPGLPLIPGIGTTPKSIPLFMRFGQSQGPEIIIANLPCAINCWAMSPLETILGRTPTSIRWTISDNPWTAPSVATPTLRGSYPSVVFPKI